MADDLGLGLGNINVGQILHGAGEGFTAFMTWLAILGVLAVLVLYILYIKKFKHRFVIRDLTRGVTRVREDKARIFKDKADGVEKWRLLKFKKSAQVPPSEAISLTAKGNFYVEAYYSEEEGFRYIIPDKLNSQKSVDKLTTNQKLFITHEFVKAEQDKPKRLGDFLAMAMPYAALALVVIFGIIVISSWKDITEPLVQMANTNAQVTSDMKQIMKSQENILFKVQSLDSEEIPQGDG